MWMTDHHIFGHLYKTGGSTVRKSVEALRGGRMPPGINEHDPITRVPRHLLESRSTIGVARDPASWYVSLYCHARRNSGTYSERLEAFGAGEIDFPAALYGMTHPDPERCPEVFGLLVSYWGDPLLRSEWLRSGLGLCTFLHLLLYGREVGWAHMSSERGPWAVDSMLDTALLWDGLSELLDEDVRPGPGKAHQHINERPDKQGPRDPLEWYDAESLGWVLDADAWLYDAFDFTPGACSSRALHQLTNAARRAA